MKVIVIWDYFSGGSYTLITILSDNHRQQREVILDGITQALTPEHLTLLLASASKLHRRITSATQLSQHLQTVSY